MINPSGAEETVETRLFLALRAVFRRLKERNASPAMDPAAFYVLHVVGAHDQLRLSHLAELIGLDASTVSRHVRQLENAGHLVRTTDPRDRRACQVSVSVAGRTVLHEIAERHRARIADAMAGWSGEDRETLTALLERLAVQLGGADARTAEAATDGAGGGGGTGGDGSTGDGHTDTGVVADWRRDEQHHR